MLPHMVQIGSMLPHMVQFGSMLPHLVQLGSMSFTTKEGTPSLMHFLKGELGNTT